jgi:hypothetical protein
VLEDIGRFRGRAPPVDQLRRHELAEGALQRQSLKRRDRFQQAVREFAPDRCPDLCDLLRNISCLGFCSSTLIAERAVKISQGCARYYCLHSPFCYHC